MDSEKYRKYCIECEDWFKKEEEFYAKMKAIHDSSLPNDKKEKRQERIRKKYGKDGNSFDFGPWVEIYDPKDLLDPNFILPGHKCSFLNLSNTDHDIPSYFGKYIISEFPDYYGKVIGYAYDMGDDYIIALHPSGETRAIIVNSHYKIYDNSN